MNISDAADITSLQPKTIRYYEEIGLITPNRTANGYRSFTETHIHQLTFLARARALGFSVEDCPFFACPLGGSGPGPVRMCARLPRPICYRSKTRLQTCPPCAIRCVTSSIHVLVTTDQTAQF